LHGRLVVSDSPVFGPDEDGVATTHTYADAHFVAAARTDIPALIAAVESLFAALVAVEAERDTLREAAREVLKLRNAAYYALYPGIGGEDDDSDGYQVVEDAVNRIGGILASVVPGERYPLCSRCREIREALRPDQDPSEIPS
jgi:hypothetical protein